LANGEDGLQAMRLIDAIYKSARTGQVVRMENG
jgi:predicted dehydrogenase